MRIPEEFTAKLKRAPEQLIAGSHGQKMLKDIIYGSTVDNLSDRVRIPVPAIPAER